MERKPRGLESPPSEAVERPRLQGPGSKKVHPIPTLRQIRRIRCGASPISRVRNPGMRPATSSANFSSAARGGSFMARGLARVHSPSRSRVPRRKSFCERGRRTPQGGGGGAHAGGASPGVVGATNCADFFLLGRSNRAWRCGRGWSSRERGCFTSGGSSAQTRARHDRLRHVSRGLRRADTIGSPSKACDMVGQLPG